MLHKEIPFLRIDLPLCTGILTGLVFHPGNRIVFILLLISVLLILISICFNNRFINYFYGFSLSVALIIAGNLLYNNEKSRLSVLNPEESLFLCSLSDYPEEKENSYSLTVNLLLGYNGEKTNPLNGSMLLYNSKKAIQEDMLPGDLMIIRCTPAEVVNRGNPCEFDYRFYLENRGIKYFAFTDASDILWTHKPLKRTLRNYAFIARNRLIKMFEERGITGEKLALVAAITLGQKSLLDPETKLNFTKAGAMHIMAVSGLNAGILCMFIFNILFFMKGKLGAMRAIITIAVIWLFAFITGLSPSVERATFMFTFIQAGKIINRQANDINSVLASAFVMMLIQPSVVFDTGFQLSYVAVLFIVVFYKNLHDKLIITGKFPELVWQIIAVTLIAQAGTLALTIMSFNRFPVYFLLTNIIVVPVSSLMIILACLLLFTFPVPFISEIFAVILNIAVWTIRESVRIISSTNYSSIENIGMPAIQCILLTIFIAIVLFRLLIKKRLPLFIPLSFLVVIIVYGSVTYIINKRSNELVVYNTMETYTIGIRTGLLMHIYREDKKIPAEVSRHCSVKGFKMRCDSLVNGTARFTVDTTDILICRSISAGENILKGVDILILTGKNPEIINLPDKSDLPANIVITSEASSYYSPPACLSKNGHPLYHVSKSGAISFSL